jgi:hypothetical protein
MRLSAKSKEPFPARSVAPFNRRKRQLTALICTPHTYLIRISGFRGSLSGLHFLKEVRLEDVGLNS